MNREAGAWQIIFSRVSNASKERISTSTSLEFGFWKCERCIDISFEIHELIVIKSRPMNREARAVQAIFGTVSVASKACSSTRTCLVFGFWKCERCIDISFEIQELIIIKSRETDREARAVQARSRRVFPEPKEFISTVKPMVFGF
jgi:hypothetical protein